MVTEQRNKLANTAFDKNLNLDILEKQILISRDTGNHYALEEATEEAPSEIFRFGFDYYFEIKKIDFDLGIQSAKLYSFKDVTSFIKWE